MIEIKKLSKDYNGKQALDSINIVLPTNGLVSVIGNNGSGKTTLLRVLSTTLCASSGTVKFDNVIYGDLIKAFSIITIIITTIIFIITCIYNKNDKYKINSTNYTRILFLYILPIFLLRLMIMFVNMI